MGRTSHIRQAAVFNVIQRWHPQPVTVEQIQAELTMLSRSQIEACIRRLEVHGQVQTQVILTEQEVRAGGNGNA